MTVSTQPWDRQDDEPANWFARFEAFRLLGPERTLEQAWRLAQQNGAKRSKAQRPSGDWYEISARWHWRRRAEAWDESERQRLLRQRGRELEEAQRRHASIAQLLLAKGIEALTALEPAKLSPGELRGYLLSGVELELQSLIEPQIAGLLRRIDELEARACGATEPAGHAECGDPAAGPAGPEAAAVEPAPPSPDLLPGTPD